MRSIVITAAAAILSSAAPAQTDGLRYRVQPLPSLPGGNPGNVAIDVNDAGQVCGQDFVEEHEYRPFRWDSQTGQILDLGTLPGCLDVGAYAYGINDLGHVCGYDWGGPVDCNAEAWLWTPSTGMVGIAALPGGIVRSSSARAVNNLNQIVGESVGPRGGEAFLWDPVNGIIGLGEMGGQPPVSAAYGINDSTWIVGAASSTRGVEAFLWTPEDGMIGLGDFYNDAFADSDAFAINALGHVVGSAAHPETVYQSFLWTAESGLIGLGVLDPNSQYQSNAATDINDRDEVIGVSAGGSSGEWCAFIWDAVQGMREIGALVDPCETRQRPFPHLGAVGINNAGQIAVNLEGERNSVLLTPYLPGDLDEDAAVTLADLGGLLSNFGRVGIATYEHGDLDCDADVDLTDLAILLSNFGEALP